MVSHLKSPLLVACVCGVGCVNSAFGTVDLGNSTGELIWNGGALGSMHYRIFLPDGYNASQNYPVVLYLHSAAERGNTTADIFNIYNLNGDGQTVDNPWIKPLIQQTQHGSTKAILITPESGAYQYWCGANNGENWNAPNFTNGTAPAETNNEKMVMQILGNVQATQHVDSSKIFITGPSMGGWGTWDMMARYPTTFAKGVPLSGGGNITAAGTTLATKPIWDFHGATDSLISPSHSTDLVNAMNAADGSTTNGNPVYSLVPGVGHGGWETFYTPNTYHTGSPTVVGGSNGLDLYGWLFAPEPTSLSLVAVGALALLRRRSCR